MLHASHALPPVIILCFNFHHNLLVTISAEMAHFAVSSDITDFLHHHPSAALQQGAECDTSQPGDREKTCMCVCVCVDACVYSEVPIMVKSVH